MGSHLETGFRLPQMGDGLDEMGRLQWKLEDSIVNIVPERQNTDLGSSQAGF